MRPHPLLTALIALASGLVAGSARADERPSAAFSVRFGGFGRAPLNRDALDRELAAAGYPRLSPMAPGFDFGIGAELGPVSLELDIGAAFEPMHGNTRTMISPHVFLVGGYQLIDRLPFGITPRFGLGMRSDSLCPQQPGSGPLRPSDPPFRQLLSSPTPDTCLSVDAFATRASLAFDYDLLFSDDSGVGGLRFRLEPGLETSLASSSWRTSFRGESLDIAGPAGPPMAFTLGLSVGMLVGM
jgi:hypothetical protein